MESNALNVNQVEVEIIFIFLAATIKCSACFNIYTLPNGWLHCRGVVNRIRCSEMEKERCREGIFHAGCPTLDLIRFHLIWLDFIGFYYQSALWVPIDDAVYDEIDKKNKLTSVMKKYGTRTRSRKLWTACLVGYDFFFIFYFFFFKFDCIVFDSCFLLFCLGKEMSVGWRFEIIGLGFCWGAFLVSVSVKTRSDCPQD